MNKWEAVAVLLRELGDISPTECWLSSHTLSKEGYARIRVSGKQYQAHRLVYEVLRAPADGMTIDHVCHTRSECQGGPSCLHRRCINPAHLEAVPAVVNSQRQWSARKPECVNGHPFSPENTYIRTSTAAGRRGCRACNRAAVARYNQKRGAA